MNTCEEKNVLKKISLHIVNFLKANFVFVIATICAIISMCFVYPDKKYLEYIDYKTIVSLFCMLLVICALRNIMFFRILAKKIITIFKSTRSAISALIFITYFSSMLIANDMALITFLPLGYYVLNSTKKDKYMMFTFIMQTIAANLGGMITPFGNPQNLFLYNYFNIPTLEFFSIMWIPTLVSVLLILICCFFIKKEPLDVDDYPIKKLNVKKSIIYFIMFIYSIIIVFRVVPYWTGLLFIPIMLILDRKALLNVDYCLLLTFVMFFIFAGNMARIPAVNNFFELLLSKNVLITGVLSCQIISNVPSSILLSSFTNDYAPLLVAVNIGGCGTLISSLASIITFKQFCLYQPKKTLKYLLVFHLINFAFLAILTTICFFTI